MLEDEVGVRHLSVRILRNLGYEVLEAAHGDDAKRLITQRGAAKIDLLLTDMVMPEISGRHFADWLRASQSRRPRSFSSPVTWRNRSIPHDRRDPECSFLAKPFNAESSRRKVRECLDGGAETRIETSLLRNAVPMCGFRIAARRLSTS